MAKAEAKKDRLPELQADMQALIEHLTTGKPLAPDTYRRIRERGQQITAELREKYGELDIAVPAICELRGELRLLPG
jgi:hypothetical protein